MTAGDKWPLQDYLDRVERAAINEALEKTRYNRTAAAKLLGHHVSRNALPDGAARHQVTVRRVAGRMVSAAGPPQGANCSPSGAAQPRQPQACGAHQ